MKLILSKETFIFYLLLFHIFAFSQKTTSDVIYKKRFIGKLKENKKNDKSDPIKSMARNHLKIASESISLMVFFAKESIK